MKKLIILFLALAAIVNVPAKTLSITSVNDDNVQLSFQCYADSTCILTQATRAIGEVVLNDTYRFTFSDEASQAQYGDVDFKLIAIANYAFLWKNALTKINIPNYVLQIGASAFTGCSNLSEISMPNSLVYIEEAAFSDCESLSDIIIPQSVKYIGTFAFDGCTSLKTIFIPQNVDSIGLAPFYNCTSLTAINVDEANTHYRSIDGVLFDKEVKVLLSCAGGKIGRYSIPESVEEIEERAFSYCHKLTSISIPKNLTTFGEWSLEFCTSLTSLYNYATTPQFLLGSVFNGDDLDKCTLYVPKQSLELYSGGWYGFQFKEVLPIEEEEGINDPITFKLNGEKTIRDGQVLIKQKDKTYTTNGIEIK
ncbi:MAG: leucine-rich repeat domain-containing protein [Paludibacteraceae bacterium]